MINVKRYGKFGSGLLQFFYCTTITTQECESDCESWLPFSPCQLVRVVRSDNSPAVFNIPEIEDLFEAQLIIGWEEVEYYPYWTKIGEFGMELDREEKALFKDYLYRQGG